MHLLTRSAGSAEQPARQFRARCARTWVVMASLLLGVLAAPQLAAAAELPKGGRALIEQAHGALKPFGPLAGSGAITEVEVSGQPFARALRVDTHGRAPGKGDSGLVAGIRTPLAKGDVLWIGFKARRLKSSRETGEAFINVRFEQLANGKYTWPSHVERGISIGGDWSETMIPFVMEKDVTPDQVQLAIHFDTYEQSFEMGPVHFLHFGREVALADLPRSVIRYEGDEADAPWREQARARIERLRKGDLLVRVEDAAGKPLRGAQVTVRMRRNAFDWGTAITSELVLKQDSADAAHYREKLAAYFNEAVFENEAKAKNWPQQDPRDKGGKIKRAVGWLKEHGINTRGHVLVWPSWRNTQHLAGIPNIKSDPEVLRKALLDGIAEQAGVLRGQFHEWDVINEATLHREFMDILGRREMVAWFKAARQADPQARLYLNDYTMFHGAGPGSPSQAFYDNVQFLKEQGAQMDAIGEQAHIGGTPPGIPYVLERLDHFGQLKVPIKITEFDINSNDDEYKARYLSDFMTAVYSHPATNGFVQWGFWEGAHWFPVAALWSRDWTLRKHGQAYIDLVRKTWWTDADARTSATGSVKVRGFTGLYSVTVQHKGRTATREVSLTRDGARLVVRL